MPKVPKVRRFRSSKLMALSKCPIAAAFKVRFTRRFRREEKLDLQSTQIRFGLKVNKTISSEEDQFRSAVRARDLVSSQPDQLGSLPKVMDGASCIRLSESRFARDSGWSYDAASVPTRVVVHPALIFHPQRLRCPTIGLCHYPLILTSPLVCGRLKGEQDNGEQGGLYTPNWSL